MYSSYGLGSTTLGTAAAIASVGAVLAFIAFVAAIVVTVLLSRKYLVEGGAPKMPGMKKDWGPFFRFENLIVEKILQVLYIFAASLICFECAAAVLTSIFSLTADPAGALAGVVGICVLFVLLEVLNRLGFEMTMMTILIWKNTSVIRRTLTGGQSAGNGFGAAGGSAPVPPTAPVGVAVGTSAAGTAPSTSGVASAAGAPAYKPVSPTPHVSNGAPAAEPEGWTCENCGAHNKTGSFCAQCGHKRG